MQDETPLVLLPGMNLSARLWARCRLPPGTITPVPGAASMDENVEQLLDQLPPRFILGGLSLGGIIAMHVAAVAPQRVAGLLLMATNAKGPTDEQRRAWQETITVVSQGQTPSEYQISIMNLLLSETAAAQRQLVDATVAGASDLDPQVLINQLSTQITRVDERPGVKNLDVPTEILAGDRDLLCPVSNHEEIRELVPGSELTVVEGVGHLIPLEAPDAVTQAIEAIRARVDNHKY